MKGRLIKSLVPLVLVACVAGLWWRIQWGKREISLQPPHERTTISDFLLERRDGSEYAVSQLRGRPVLLEVWASWCAPCATIIPDLNRLHTIYGENLAVIGLNVDSAGWPVVDSYLERHPEIAYSIARLKEPHAIQFSTLVEVGPLGSISVIPSLFLLDEQGRLAGKYVGPDSLPALEQDIEALLEATGPPQSR